ncbi:hypothetical protein H0H92_003461 [Tricholoma furcatifolium]|nr:hypothetical protein H0H92_003461 [Tricholoma furcatifolium]
MSSQLIVPKPHPVPGTETYREKAVRKFKENPWVPLGAFATVGALVVAMVKMRRGQSHSFNKWLRVRVAAQGLTILAICAGTWSVRPGGVFGTSPVAAEPSNLPRADADAEQRRLEKAAREKEEFEERLRGAESAHAAESELRGDIGNGSIRSPSEVKSNPSRWSWLWGRSGSSVNAKPTAEQTETKKSSD